MACAALGKTLGGAFGIDRLTSALLDYGDRRAAFTVGTPAGSDAWGAHQQLSVLGSKGWLRMNFAFPHARPTACLIKVGDVSSVARSLKSPMPQLRRDRST
ncbi:hypothetical protein WKW77_29620 [Variovorax ureilyticus]|uniref:Uncharacterized protein n=1 Tax=Variovorax ureilyticus TaxID=1836198 RepID=A0ABU8VNM9_9BURK